MAPKYRQQQERWPLFIWLGLLLIAIFWPVNWLLEGLRTHWAFFPLWLGYVLTVEGITFRRQGDALLTRNWQAFLLLFPLSVPFWWLFEAFNSRMQYWQYYPVESFSDLEYAILCSISFSVVLPAIFSTAELFTTFSWLRRISKGFSLGRRRGTVVLFFLLGWIFLGIALIWPAYGAAFLWMSLYFILDPINYWLGRPALLRQTARGDWRLVLALWSGSLVCGFFWEMWNYYSLPKWQYDVPFVDFWPVFEMPLLGYLGYLPFSLEIYAIYSLLSTLLPEKLRIFPEI